MTTRRWTFALLSTAILLAGCTAADAQRNSPTGGDGASAHGAPQRAAMVCGPEIAGELTQILRLDDSPHVVSAWADPVYTCTYHLPYGPLVLSVTVSDSDAAADAFFADQQRGQPGAEPIVGLGEQAYRTPDGLVTVVKDDMTLTVDATDLPAVLGDNRQRRSALAFEVGATVLGCWTEHD